MIKLFILCLCLAGGAADPLEIVKFDPFGIDPDAEDGLPYDLVESSAQIVDYRKPTGEYLCAFPFEGTVALAGKRYVLGLDSTDLEAEGFNRLRFDENGNGDLADDPLLEAIPLDETTAEEMRSTGHFIRSFPRIDLKLPVDGKMEEYGFVISGIRQKLSRVAFQSDALLRAAVYHRGEVAIDGKRTPVFLCDANSNGRFDDRLSVVEGWDDALNLVDPIAAAVGGFMRTEGDALFIGARHALGSRDALGKKHTVAELVHLDDRFFRLAVSPSGDRLSLTPLTQPIGYVSNPAPRFTALVYGDLGAVEITGQSATPYPLPAGKWTLAECTIDETPSDGKRNRVTARGAPKNPKIEVRAGETVPLPFGPPYRPLVIVDLLPSSDEATLILEITGRGGEVVTRMEVNGRNPPRPLLTIKEKEGSVVTRGLFRYG